MSISITNLTKIFGEQIAVNNISFNIEKGNIVGFLGPNGAGKSTTMKMITSYIFPTSGKIDVCGIDVTKQPIAARKLIGYMPERNPLYYDMYVKEYLEFAAGIHQIGTEKKKRIENMISLTGLHKEVKKKIGALSKGYKQRIGLAQAMIHNPDVLILDEPTSGLDPNQLVDIRNVIKEIGREKTVLLSTHIMQEVEAMCNRVIIINNGNIVADNNINEIQHSHKDKHTYLKIQFDKSISENQLKECTHLISTQKVNDTTWIMTTIRPDDLKKELMVWAVKNDIIITTMHTEEQSLEEVFRHLTH